MHTVVQCVALQLVNLALYAALYATAVYVGRHAGMGARQVVVRAAQDGHHGPSAEW